jgi:aerobic carbon-monoxide dehydrogenase medium subunit
MKPAQFTYHSPRTVEEAVALLVAVAPLTGRVLAGGQSLVPAMALRLATPAHLIDINGVAGFDRLQVEAGELSIGACVRHVAFQHQVIDGPLGGMLKEVARHIAHYPIRTRGTFCGSLANADPASEWCLVAQAIDARIVARGTDGARTIAAADFFRGVMTTVLAPDELLVEARLPVLAPDTRWGFYKVSRRAGDFAIAMALAVYRLENGVIVQPRVAVGGVESHPRRIEEAEAGLSERAPSSGVFQAAADAAADAVQPVEDKPEISRYKRDVTRAAVRRALEAAQNRA